MQNQIALAASYFSKLLSQGLSVQRALDHAVQRFGVRAGEILAEVKNRHEYELPHVAEDAR